MSIENPLHLSLTALCNNSRTRFFSDFQLEIVRLFTVLPVGSRKSGRRVTTNPTKSSFATILKGCEWFAIQSGGLSSAHFLSAALTKSGVDFCLLEQDRETPYRSTCHGFDQQANINLYRLLTNAYKQSLVPRFLPLFSFDFLHKMQYCGKQVS